jgi:aminocarboxymuconate-semialdehyde decarboxylase
MAEGAALRPAVCRCGVDVHSHVVPHDFPAYLGAKVPAQWPSMAPAHECHRSVMIAGKLYRAVSDKAWTTARRLADLPAMGLTRQAISPMPELLSYWMDGPDAQQLLRYINEQIAAMVDESAGALVGLGAVPLQDIDLAIAELRHVMTLPGFAGVEIGSNINGVPVGHASLDPFFEACEALGAAVFVHALKPAGMDRLVGPAPLQQVLAYPTDVGLAAASAITGNLLLRRPRLRIAFSHGGGTLAALLPRLQQSWSVFPALAESVQAAPAEQARRLYYDTLVFDAPMLRMLVASFGASQLILGSDYPFNFGETAPVDRVEAAGFDADVAAQLVHRNAETFLGLAARSAP